ncbi:hypothetical protein D3C81_1306100 [compost metagenome]
MRLQAQPVDLAIGGQAARALVADVDSWTIELGEDFFARAFRDQLAQGGHGDDDPRVALGLLDVLVFHGNFQLAIDHFRDHAAEEFLIAAQQQALLLARFHFDADGAADVDGVEGGYRAGLLVGMREGGEAGEGQD